ncbi:MAG TPA: hypothetical protein VHN81_05910, partial [Edaphobacter sp.]|nr:hypothetical protein [Edaphobacter sp.]
GLFVCGLDSIQSFLVAPIGIKPNHVYDGFGNSWLLYLGSSIVCGMICYLLYRLINVMTARLTESKEAVEPVYKI